MKILRYLLTLLIVTSINLNAMNCEIKKAADDLQRAIHKNNIEAVKELLEKHDGTQLCRARTWPHAWTALHQAANMGRTEIFELLLTFDNSNELLCFIPNTAKCTALHLAAAGGHIEIVKLILKQPFPSNLCSKVDMFGFTALKLAQHNKNIEIIALLDDEITEEQIAQMNKEYDNSRFAPISFM